MKATQQILAVAWTKTHKILIVDDTQDNLDLMVEALKTVRGLWQPSAMPKAPLGSLPRRRLTCSFSMCICLMSTALSCADGCAASLLLDIAEQVVAESCIETVGAHV